VLISVVVFVSVLLLVLAVSPLWRMAEQWRTRAEAGYRTTLSELFITDWTPAAITTTAALTSVTILGILWWALGILPAMAAAVAVWFVPQSVLAYLRAQRLEKFDAQLTDGLDLLANAVKSGQTLAQALEVVATQSLPPLSQEFGLMVQEYQLGVALDRVLLDARQRLSSKNLALTVAALLVSREKGGNLPETLTRIAESIREIRRLEEKIRTSTAEGRKSARTMAIMPVVLGFMLYSMDPESFGLLFVDPVGNALLVVVVGLVIGSFLWIRRIVNVPI
jgi:tight adherence protein B